MKKRNLTVMRMLSVTMISAVLSTGISAPLAPVQAVQAAEAEQAPGVDTNADTPQAREGEVKELTVTAVNETYGSGTQEFTVTVTGEGATVAEGTQRSYQILEGEGVVKAAEGEGAEGKFSILKAGSAKIQVTDTTAAAADSQAKEGEGTVTAQGICEVTIAPKEITAAFSTEPSNVNIGKVYDGTADLPADSGTDSWKDSFNMDVFEQADKDKLAVTITYAFDGKDAAENKKIIATVELSDKDSSDPAAGNYTWASNGDQIEVANSGAITAKELKTASVTGKDGAAITKEYDGKTEVASSDLQKLQISFDAADIITGDTVSAPVTSCNFDDKAVGTGKTLKAAIGTVDNANYKLADGVTEAGGTGEITPKALSASVTGTVEKTYDGNESITSDNTTNNSLDITLTGKVDSEDVSVDKTKVQYSFTDKAKGTGKKVTAQVPAEALTGDDAANYKLAEGEIAGDSAGTITAKELTPKFAMAGELIKYIKDDDADKTGISDAEAKAAGLEVQLDGVCGQDQVSATAAYQFADDTVTTSEEADKVIKATQITLGGTDAANYNVTATVEDTGVKGKILKTNGTELQVTVTNIEDAEYGDELTQADIESHITRPENSTGILTFAPKSGSESILELTADGSLKIKGTGEATLTYTIAADAEYAQATGEMTVKASARKLTPKVVFNAEKAPVKYVGEDAEISAEEAAAAGLKVELYDKNDAAVSEEAVTAGTPSFAFSDTSAAGETTVKATNLTLSDSTNYAWADGIDVSAGIVSEATVQVKEPVAIEKVYFQDLELDENGEASVQLNVGGEVTLTPVAEPAEAAFTVESWASDKTDIATVTDGKVTAQAEGTAKITVTVKERGANGASKTAVCNVEVVSADTLTKVEITGLTDKKLSLPVGEEAQLTTAVTPEGLEGVSYTWESEDTSVAAVDETGKVSALAAGTAKITVTAAGAEGKGTATDWCTVEVTNEEVPVTGITLDKTSLELTAGTEGQLTATVAPENATNKAVTWSSSDEAVVTVADGKVTAVAAGTAEITASCGGMSAVCTVTVKAADSQDTVAVTDMTLDQEKLTLKVGGTAKLNAAVLPENASNKNIVWSSSDEKIASVDAQGTVTAVAAGSAVITASSEENSAIKKECSVTVTAAGSSGGSSSGGSSSGGSSSGGGWGGSYGGSSGGTGSGNTSTTPGTTTPGTGTPGTTTPGTGTPGTTTPGTAQKPAPENKVITNVKEQPNGTFVNAAGETVANAIVQTADGTKYITDQKGQKITKSVVTTTDGTMYCTKADGAVAHNQTVTLGGNKYFAKADGAVARDEFCETKYGNTVYAKADGTLAVNTTIKVDGSKYFAKKSGAIAKGEFCTTPAGSTVYAKADGTLATNGIITVSNKKYFAKKSGAIAKKAFSTTAKGSTVYSNASGVIVTNKIFKVNGKKYFAKKSGAVAKKTWVTVGNKMYYCNASGRITKTKAAKQV